MQTHLDDELGRTMDTCSDICRILNCRLTDYEVSTQLLSGALVRPLRDDFQRSSRPLVDELHRLRQHISMIQLIFDKAFQSSSSDAAHKTPVLTSFDECESLVQRLLGTSGLDSSGLKAFYSSVNCGKTITAFRPDYEKSIPCFSLDVSSTNILCVLH